MTTGRGAAWSAHLLWEQGVAGSNPAVPTTRCRRPLTRLTGARWKPATAHNRYRSLHAFFKWAVAEGDLEASPMDGMKPPHLPEQPVGVIRADQLVRLLKICEGRDFTSRRDTAIILLLVDTGMRRAEGVGA
jgi:integrase/recombinase XerC